MLIPNTEMHVLTAVFVLLELMMLAVQLYHYFSQPEDRPRFYFLLLLALLVFYNITGGLFPDPGIPVSTILQNMVAYGSGFLMAAYFPLYFYKSFRLTTLRWQAYYGVSWFLLLPYLIFFVLIYGLNGDLDFARDWGLIVPFVYSLVVLRKIFLAIRRKFRIKKASKYPPGRIEVLSVYAAVSPWVCLSVFAFFNVDQWIEVTVTNLGFVLVSVLFLQRSAAMNRILNNKRLAVQQQGLSFAEKAAVYGLSAREREIAELLSRGLTYKEIGEALFISERTVDTHVQNIFSKTGVNKRLDLLGLLGPG